MTAINNTKTYQKREKHLNPQGYVFSATQNTDHCQRGIGRDITKKCNFTTKNLMENNEYKNVCH